MPTTQDTTVTMSLLHLQVNTHILMSAILPTCWAASDDTPLILAGITHAEDVASAGYIKSALTSSFWLLAL